MINDSQQQIIKNILMPFEPYKIGIFGSYARNEQKKQSDIDILVSFKKRVSLFDLVDLEEQLSEKLNCKIDLITERSLNPSLKKHVEKDLHLIYE